LKLHKSSTLILRVSGGCGGGGGGGGSTAATADVDVYDSSHGLLGCDAM